MTVSAYTYTTSPVVDGTNMAASDVNTPMNAANAQIASLTTEVIAGRGATPSLDARFALLGGAGGVVTLTNGLATTGQKVVTVDSTSGFVAGTSVIYLVDGTTLESNTIATVDSGTQVTLTTNIGGSTGIADNGEFAQRTLEGAAIATAGNYGGTVTSPTAADAVAWAGGRMLNAEAYGAVLDSVTDNTVAVQAAIDAAGDGGVVFLPYGCKYTPASLVLDANVAIWDFSDGDYLNFIANGGNASGAVNEWRFQAGFHPGIVIDNQSLTWPVDTLGVGQIAGGNKASIVFRAQGASKWQIAQDMQNTGNDVGGTNSLVFYNSTTGKHMIILHDSSSSIRYGQRTSGQDFTAPDYKHVFHGSTSIENDSTEDVLFVMRGLDASTDAVVNRKIIRMDATTGDLKISNTADTQIARFPDGGGLILGAGTTGATTLDVTGGIKFTVDLEMGKDRSFYHNSYYSSGYKYRATGYANNLTFDGGAWKFSSAASGTAGSAISFHEDLRLHNSGGLSLGSTYVGTDPAAGNAIISGSAGIGTSTVTTGKLSISNADATTRPVLHLTQLDVSEEVIEINSTAGTGNAVEAVGAKTLTVTDFIKITLNGATRYIQAGTIA